MSKIKNLIIKYKAFIFYVLFGMFTTLVNIAAYYVSYNIAKVPNVISTIIAWVLAVAFAFITNKLWVFDSKSFDKKTLLHEIWTFTAARFITGLIDVAVMYFAVDVFVMNSTIWKIASNVIVIILNYIFSKLFVFKKNNSDHSDT